jgi:hypothetical protein
MTKQVPFSLEVVAAPEFFLAIDPTHLVVARGSVAVFNVMVTGDGGFAGPVTLSVVGMPVGAVATFDKATYVPGETAVLTVAAGEGMTIGAYQMAVEGTATV